MTCNNITGVLGSCLPQTKCFSFVWGKDTKPRSPLLPGIEFSLSQCWVQDWSRSRSFNILACFLHFHCGTKGVSELWRHFKVSNLHNSNSQLLGRAKSHPLVDALPNSAARFYHRGMATPGILTTTKTLGERMENGALGILLECKAYDSKNRYGQSFHWIGRDRF